MIREPKATAGKQDAKPALTPKLRFPEFRDAPEWKKKRLGSLGKFLRGLTYGATDVSETGLLVLRSTNIQNTNLVLDRDLVFIDKTCADELLLLPKDIVICMSNGSKALVGKSAEYKGDYQGDLTVGAFCSLFRPSNQFSKLAFQSEQYAKFVSISIGGGNINNLKNSDLENFGLPVPPDHAEQQKIAECLTTLDEVIAAQSQKLDALKTHKKGLMQQLFPREGETLPRLRFPEFQAAPEWTEATLTELFDFQDGFSFKSTDFTSSSGDATQVIRITDINNRNKNADKVYVSNDFLESANLKKYYAERGDLLLSLTGAAGFNFFIWDGTPALLNQRTTKITPRDDANFALIHLLESLVHERINGRGEGQNNNLSREFLSTVILHLPKSLEQQRIATCLTTLDVLITAQSAKLSALKTHKKGLMQQLFPSPEEVGA